MFSGTIQLDFTNQINSFDKKKFTIYAFDLPGYGRSRPHDKEYDKNFYEIDANLMMKVMNKLQIDKYSVLGFSDGGRTALWMAGQDYHNSIEKIVVWGASGWTSDQEKHTVTSFR